MELILEGATQLIDEKDIETLTTNAIANRAGVSIGTLYQYFNDKKAVIDVLTERELGNVVAQVLEALQGSAPSQPGGKIRKVMRAFLATFGSKRGIRQKLLAYHLAHGRSQMLSSLIAKAAEMFAGEGIPLYGEGSLTKADAFVLANAFAGVMRGVVRYDDHPGLDEVEVSLAKLLGNFVLGPGFLERSAVDQHRSSKQAKHEL